MISERVSGEKFMEDVCGVPTANLPEPIVRESRVSVLFCSFCSPLTLSHLRLFPAPPPAGYLAYRFLTAVFYHHHPNRKRCLEQSFIAVLPVCGRPVRRDGQTNLNLLHNFKHNFTHNPPTTKCAAFCGVVGISFNGCVFSASRDRLPNGDFDRAVLKPAEFFAT